MIFICDFCKEEFKMSPSRRPLEKKFCNKKCESKWKIEYYKDPKHREECNTWEGKKHTEETKIKMSKNMTGIIKRPLTDIEKKLQRSFWTKERREFQRKIMEDKGLWAKLEDKEDWDIYKIQSAWMKPMFNYMSKEELKPLRKYGIFNVENNKNGIVRHHLFSRAAGFDNKIFPILLRHPCNCGLLQNKDNIKRTRNDLTIEELIDKITKYDKDWIEQIDCLRYIKKHNNGERWDKLTYIETFEIKYE